MDVYIAEGSLQLYFTNPTYTSMIFFSGRKEERHLGPRPWARRKDSDSHHNSPEDRKSEIIQSRLKRTDRTLPSSSSICRIYASTAYTCKEYIIYIVSVRYPLRVPRFDGLSTARRHRGDLGHIGHDRAPRTPINSSKFLRCDRPYSATRNCHNCTVIYSTRLAC